LVSRKLILSQNLSFKLEQLIDITQLVAIFLACLGQPHSIDVVYKFCLKKILSLMSVNELCASGNNLPKQLLTIGNSGPTMSLYNCE